MPSLSSLNVSLTEELEGFVRNRVSSGRYATSSEVVREGLTLEVGPVRRRGVEPVATTACWCLVRRSRSWTAVSPRPPAQSLPDGREGDRPRPEMERHDRLDAIEHNNAGR